MPGSTHNCAGVPRRDFLQLGLGGVLGWGLADLMRLQAAKPTSHELANAIRLDPSMFPSLGPSLASIAAMLKERREKILATYETEAARREAKANVREQVREVEPPGPFRNDFKRAIQQEQICDLEKLWY